MAPAHWKSFLSVRAVHVPHDESEASLRAAADTGNFLKECALAQILFERGDYDGAFKHYSHASERGSAGATHNVGLMTELGIGTARSVPGAVKLYRRAARDGIVEARHRLGYHLALTGDGGGSDAAEGARLICAAAEDGLPEAMLDMGMMHLYNVALAEGTAGAYTGMTWLKRAFGEGKRSRDTEDVAAEAAFHLAVVAYTVPTAKPDASGSSAAPPSGAARHAIARQYAKHAAEAGHALAQDFLGQLLVKGAGAGAGDSEDSAANLEEAATWFGAAAAQGVISSKRDLALLIEIGMVQAGAAAEARAARLYQEAADAGDIMSTFRLGICYGTGKLVAQDTDRSRELLLEAARGDCIPAIAHVLSTKMVEPGTDEETNFKLALTKIARRERHPGRIDAIRALSALGAIPSCHGCGITKYERDNVALSLCATCQAARYCTRACQAADWKNHRNECKAIVHLKEDAQRGAAAADTDTTSPREETAAGEEEAETGTQTE